MKRLVMIATAAALTAVAGSAYALTPSRNLHHTVHVHHAAHQSAVQQAKPGAEFAPGPKVIPDPEIYQQVQ